MNYKAKRMKSKLSTYTVAKELGIDWNKYKDIEKNKIRLEGEYLDNFLKITESKNAKMINFNRKQRMHDIRNFVREGKLRELMLKRNYNIMVLARTLDYEPNVMAQIMNGSCESDDSIEFVYDFLQNPINAYVDSEEVRSEETEEIEESEVKKDRYAISKEDKDFIEKINKLKEEKKIGCVAISKGTGIPASTISHALKGRNTKKSKLKKIYDYLLNYTEEEQPLNEYEAVLKENKISKMDIARALDINYSYVYNFFKGAKIAEKQSQKIVNYINNLESNKQIEEETQVENVVENSVIEEKIIPTTMLDEMLKEEVTEDMDILEEADVEEILDEDSDEFIDDEIIGVDYFEILKENNELKDKLQRAERQIMLYEKLIERIQ